MLSIIYILLEKSRLFLAGGGSAPPPLIGGMPPKKPSFLDALALKYNNTNDNEKQHVSEFIEHTIGLTNRNIPVKRFKAMVSTLSGVIANFKTWISAIYYATILII